MYMRFNQWANCCSVSIFACMHTSFACGLLYINHKFCILYGAAYSCAGVFTVVLHSYQCKHAQIFSLFKGALTQFAPSNVRY